DSNQVDMVWRSTNRPDDSVVIVRLLHSGRYQTGDANAVTSHDQSTLFPFLVQEGGIHGIAVAGTQFKDVTHFNPLGKPNRFTTVWAGISFLHRTDIGVEIHLEIPSRSHMEQMGICFVGSGDSLRHFIHRMIGYHPNGFFQTERTSKAGGSTSHSIYGLI